MSLLAAGMNQCYPAVPASVPEARRAVATLAGRAGASPERLDDIRLAVSEALTNVVVHAYGGQPGALYVTAQISAGQLWVLIADDGRGINADTDHPGLGLGLTLIARASDEFSIVPRPAGGTETQMRFRLTSSASLAGGSGAEAREGRREPGGARFCAAV